MSANFRSDNENPVAPEIMAALDRANVGTAYSYGDDAFTERVKEKFCEVFETDLEVFPLVSGTAANALAVAQTTPAYGAVICHEDSHLHTDECGAPEFYTGGAKLMTLAGANGKLDATSVEERIADAGYVGDHASKPCLLSLTQATEFGTVYSVEEVSELAQVAHEAGMAVHMDGARFANALCSLGCSASEMTWRSGVDLLSFGATKNGAMMAEALLVFDADDAEELGRRRKQAGHLISKMRYVSAQLDAYLADDLWLELAAHANRMATRLAEGLEDAQDVELVYPVHGNEIFLRMDEELADILREDGFEFYGWPGRAGLYRLVTAHCTAESDVDAFLDAVNAADGG
ncbi:MAG: low specificity L-threonine aldolase [Gammaproteobacteria bacterium]|nr:MAG: low specificity L-threonine aldolase [Gammaproteobacteria bacterium]